MAFPGTPVGHLFNRGMNPQPAPPGLRHFCASFFPFFVPVHPTPPQAILFPKIPSFWDFRSTLSSREKATCRGWILGTVLDGVAPQEKKENRFFSGAQEKVRNRNCLPWGQSSLVVPAEWQKIYYSVGFC